MGRKPREISPTGVYHIMIRGVNKQRIFEEIEDYQGFLGILMTSLYTNTKGERVDEPNFDLYAYCLMDNHVHLLIGTRTLFISDVLKRITSSYARVFNWRYQRVGHLFQDRFRSEAVNDKDYFLNLLRYIHMNPVEAMVCDFPEQYRFSSYHEIVNSRPVTVLAKNLPAQASTDDEEFTQRCQAEAAEKVVRTEDKLRV